MSPNRGSTMAHRSYTLVNLESTGVSEVFGEGITSPPPHRTTIHSTLETKPQGTRPPGAVAWGMGLGSTAKKLQTVAEKAEQVYTRLNDLREEVEETQDAVRATREQVDALEVEVLEQRALVEALAEKQGIDVDAVIADAHIREAEGAGEGSGDAADASTDSDSSDSA